MTQCEKILQLLEERGNQGVSNLELNEICFRYAGRLFDLRRQGYRIRSTHIKESIWRFTLLEEDAPQYMEFRELLRPSACCGEIVVDGRCGSCYECA